MKMESVCAICGRLIEGHKSRDHVFPRALYKWSEEYSSLEEYLRVKDIVERKENQVSTHDECNYIKEDNIPDVDRLYISLRKKQELNEIKQELTQEIKRYENNKQIILRMQQNRCLACGRPLVENGVLRRIDPCKPRHWDNACIVCHACNLAYERFEEKK